MPHPFCPPRSRYLLILYSINIPILYKKVNRNRPNQLFFHTLRQNSRGTATNHISIGLFPTSSRYAFKNSAARLLGRISGNKAQCPLLPVLFQSMPYRMLYAKRNFFEYSFHLYNNPPFIPYRCFSSIYPLFCSPIQSASWDGAFHPASPEYPSCFPAAAAPQYDLL